MGIFSGWRVTRAVPFVLAICVVLLAGSVATAAAVGAITHVGQVGRTFVDDTTYTSLSLTAADEAADGTLYVGGSYTRLAGGNYIGVVRFDSDGAYAGRFGGFMVGSAAYAPYQVDGINVAPDGSIWVAGGWSSAAAGPYVGAVQFAPSGEFTGRRVGGTDTSELDRLYRLSVVNDVAVAPDGSVCLAGVWDSRSGGPQAAGVAQYDALGQCNRVIGDFVVGAIPHLHFPKLPTGVACPDNGDVYLGGSWFEPTEAKTIYIGVVDLLTDGGFVDYISDNNELQVNDVDADERGLAYVAGYPAGSAANIAIFRRDGGVPIAQFGPFVTSGGQAWRPAVLRAGALGANRPPTLAEVGSRTVNEGDAISITLDGSDVTRVAAAGRWFGSGMFMPEEVGLFDVNFDAADLAFSATGLPSGASFDPATRTFAWTTAPGDSGSYSVTFTASDGTLTDSETIVIDVAAGNVAPRALGGAVTVTEDVASTFALPASDADGDPLTFEVLSGPAHGMVDIASGSVSYLGFLDYFGPDAITYRVSDGTLWSDPATLDITVDPVDDKPILLFAPSVTVAEGGMAVLNGTWSDPDNEPVPVEIEAAPYGDIAVDADGTWHWTFATNEGPEQNATIALTYHDDCGRLWEDKAFELNVTPLAPVMGAISGPLGPVPVGTPVTFSGGFTDPGIVCPHAGTVAFGDGSVVGCSVTEAGGSGTFSAVHSYATPGVYEAGLTFGDDDGCSVTVPLGFVVVYDPSGGFVTGGGFIESPAGAFAADAAMVGRAHFAFTSRYQKGALVPTGKTSFRFQAGELDFESTEYEWLVVSGAKAKYKGHGTIGGAGDYGFMLAAIDGGSRGADLFRIKIWDTATGAPVYDNMLGAAETADPTTAIAGGSIIVHAK